MIHKLKLLITCVGVYFTRLWEFLLLQADEWEESNRLCQLFCEITLVLGRQA